MTVAMRFNPRIEVEKDCVAERRLNSFDGVTFKRRSATRARMAEQTVG
jgi:hypothetical protein